MNPNNIIPQNDCDELRDLLPSYVIGATTGEETARVQILLQKCPEVAAEAGDYAQITIGLLETVDAIEPPANLRNRILEQAMAEPPVQENLPDADRIIKFSPWWAAAALFIILLATNLYWAANNFATQNELQDLQTQREIIYTLLSDGQFQQFELLSSDDNDTVLARLLWNTENNELAVFATNLPGLTSEQAYQVWLLNDDAVDSAGLLQIDSNNHAFLIIAPDTDLTGYTTVAISVEPASGSELPTNAPIAIGDIGA